MHRDIPISSVNTDLSSLSDGVVLLRPLVLSDVDAHLAGEDHELVRWLSGAPGTRETVEDYVRGCIAAWANQGPKLTFGIRRVTDDVLVGTIDAQISPPYLGSGQVNIAYGLYPTARGQGLATRSVGLLCRYLAQRSDVSEAVIRMDPENRASAAVAERAAARATMPPSAGEPLVLVGRAWGGGG
jgi:RimJ/RimL family protein N-acetyltransferase